MTSDQSSARYSWLEASSIRNASDVTLGGILLAAAAAAILGSRGLSFGTWAEPDAGFFPTLIGWLLAVVGTLLVARGALGRAPHMRWRTWQVVLVAACATVAGLAAWFPALVTLAGWLWDPTAFARDGSPEWTVFLLTGWLQVAIVFSRYGPPEWAAFLLLILSVAVALARLSRLRAAGMVLLGLLLQIIGLDRITGQSRLTMGLEQLLAGVDYLILAPGLILVADSMVCLFSPALLLATYTRRIAGWRDPAVSTVLGIGMRIVAVLVLAASCYLAFKVFERVLDIGVLLLFGAFGVACKIFGWNRLVLLLAFSYGELLEEKIRQTMLLLGGNPTGILEQTVSATMLAAAGCILIVALVLSLRRALSRNAAGAMAA